MLTHGNSTNKPQVLQKEVRYLNDQRGISVISILSDIFERQKQGRENNSLFEWRAESAREAFLGSQM